MKVSPEVVVAGGGPTPAEGIAVSAATDAASPKCVRHGEHLEDAPPDQREAGEGAPSGWSWRIISKYVLEAAESGKTTPADVGFEHGFKSKGGHRIEPLRSALPAFLLWRNRRALG
jgi:hypothetical protein